MILSGPMVGDSSFTSEFVKYVVIFEYIDFSDFKKCDFKINFFQLAASFSAQ